MRSPSHHRQATYQSIIDGAVRQGLPGLVLLIKTPEEGTWIGTSGCARIEDQTPIRPGSLLSAQSVTKTYTAAAVMLLKEDGLIDLGAAIDAYLPSDICDRIANGHTATVWHLLTHTSGITEGDYDWPYLAEWNDPVSWTWRDELEAAYDKTPMFSPGAGCQYTNLNYILLALIIDGLTGSHADFFRARIFQPLGMDNTYYNIGPGLPRPPGTVDIYFDRYQDGFIENASEVLYPWQNNTGYGQLGIITTMEDHARFMEGLFNGRLLSAESLQEMTTGNTVSGCEWRGLGLGIIPWADAQGQVHVTYGGEGSGMAGMSKIYHVPDSGLTFCFSTNIGAKNEFHRDLFNGIYASVLEAVFNTTNQTKRTIRR